jgi:hypothetical protein
MIASQLPDRHHLAALRRRPDAVRDELARTAAAIEAIAAQRGLVERGEHSV